MPLRFPYVLPAMLLFSLWTVIASAVSGPEAMELEQVLQELREVETRIERYLIEESGRSRAGRPAAPEPVAAAAPGGGTERHAAATAASMRDELGLGVSDEIQALARAKVEARMRLDEAEGGMRLSSILLLSEAAGGKPDGADLMTLALIQGRHRAAANLAVEELLSLEQVRFGRGTAPATPSAGRREPERQAEPLPVAIPAGATELDELRSRHRELSTRLSELSTGADQSRRSAMRFGEQRAQLNALMGRLSRSSGPELQGSGPDATTGNSNAELVPARPTEDVEKDGRRTFWRATRARIHSIAMGKVLFAGPFAGYRHLLILDHGDGWTSLYGNMTECYVRQDDALSQGSVLGEYQAEAIGNPEPFWVEVRRGAEPVKIETLPGIGEDWSTAIFRGEAL